MSLEVYYRPNTDLQIKVEARDIFELFKELGPIQEIFSNLTCGCCKGTKIRMLHRRIDNQHDGYELICETKNDRGIACGHRLALGKSGDHLFPRRYEQEKNSDGKWVPKVDADGKKVWLPHDGWVRWDSKSGKYV